MDDADAEFPRERGGALPDDVAFEHHLSGIFFDDARDDLDEGRLTGPVLAQEYVDLAGPHVEIHVVEGHDARKLLADPAHIEDEALGRVLGRRFGWVVGE